MNFFNLIYHAFTNLRIHLICSCSCTSPRRRRKVVSNRETKLIIRGRGKIQLEEVALCQSKLAILVHGSNSLFFYSLNVYFALLYICIELISISWKRLHQHTHTHISICCMIVYHLDLRKRLLLTREVSRGTWDWS